MFGVRTSFDALNSANTIKVVSDMYPKGAGMARLEGDADDKWHPYDRTTPFVVGPKSPGAQLAARIELGREMVRNGRKEEIAVTYGVRGFAIVADQSSTWECHMELERRAKEGDVDVVPKLAGVRIWQDGRSCGK